MMGKRFTLGLVVSAVLFLAVTVSYAAPALILTPSVRVEERYNDNIFLSETDKEDDFITVLSPRIGLGYHPNRYLDLDLGYGFNFRFYADHNELNDTNIRETQHADLRAQARPLNRVFIDVYDTYRRVPVDIRLKVATGNEFENMTDSNHFSVSPYVDIPLTSTLMSRFGYRFNNVWYKDDLGNGSDSHTAYVSLTNQFLSDLSVSLNYNYSAYRPEITNDYNAHHVSVTFDYRVAANLRLWGGAGRSYIDFDNRSNAESDFWNAGTEYKIDELGNTSISVEYNSSLSDSENRYRNIRNAGFQSTENIQETLQELGYLQSERNSISTGVSETKKLDMKLVTGKNVDLTINPYYSTSKELEADRKDEVTGVDVKIEKDLTTKLTLILDGLWEKQEFSPQDNEVHRYSASSSFDYLLSRSIIASAGYRYNDRNSDISGDDFTNNIVWLQARMNF
jgi:hypothetical protein